MRVHTIVPTRIQPSNTTHLRNGFELALADFYDDETAQVLADMHVLYHVRFVQQLLMASNPGMESDALVQNKNQERVKERVRQARMVDILPKGPRTDALLDEIVDYVASAGDPSMADIQHVALALGSDPNTVRTAVARLTKIGRIDRVGGSDKHEPTARYRCVP